MKTFCIISDERAFQSKSPDMFATILKRSGVKGIYVPFKVKRNQIGAAMQSLRILNIDGANITVPYKELVIPHLDVLSEGANIIGAINTIVRKDNELKGYNTNAIGFMDALDSIGFEVAGKSALVFGTGGAAKAVVFILNWLRADSIIVSGRNKEKMNSVVDRITGEKKSFESLLRQPIEVDIVINASSVSSPDESPEMAAVTDNLEFKNCEIVMDLNYGRKSNFWKDMAKKNNVKFMDGLLVLAHQARRTFALWTRIDIEPEAFLKALNEVL